MAKSDNMCVICNVITHSKYERHLMNAPADICLWLWRHMRAGGSRLPRLARSIFAQVCVHICYSGATNIYTNGENKVITWVSWVWGDKTAACCLMLLVQVLMGIELCVSVYLCL